MALLLPSPRRSGTPPLLGLFKREIEYACERNPQFGNYVRHWPVRVSRGEDDLRAPLFACQCVQGESAPELGAAECEIKRTLRSSSTSGQMPSRVLLDSATSRRMTKGVIAIIRDFIGAARRPYLGYRHRRES